MRHALAAALMTAVLTGPAFAQGALDSQRQAWLDTLSTQQRQQLEQSLPAHGPAFLGQLTDEQRQALRNLSPEERRAQMDQYRQAWLATLPAEQRQQVEQRHAEREGRRAQMEAMTPAQREEFRKTHPMPAGGGRGFGRRHGRS